MRPSRAARLARLGLMLMATMAELRRTGQCGGCLEVAADRLWRRLREGVLHLRCRAGGIHLGLLHLGYVCGFFFVFLEGKVNHIVKTGYALHRLEDPSQTFTSRGCFVTWACWLSSSRWETSCCWCDGHCCEW